MSHRLHFAKPTPFPDTIFLQPARVPYLKPSSQSVFCLNLRFKLHLLKATEVWPTAVALFIFCFPSQLCFFAETFYTLINLVSDSIRLFQTQLFSRLKMSIGAQCCFVGFCELTYLQSYSNFTQMHSIQNHKF